MRGDHEERALEDVGLSVDRHLRLLHRFEERRLGLRRRAVDLVHEDDVREDRPVPEPERAALPIEDVDAGDVRREQIGRELHAMEAQLERARERLGEDGLADAGHVLDEHVPLREKAEERQAKRLGRRMHRRAEAVDDPL